MTEEKKCLVLGYGNPAREDDGLGPAFMEALEQLSLEGVETRVDYQLCVEDAIDIGNYEQVIFVDASRTAEAPFDFFAIQAAEQPAGLNTHQLSPDALMYFARHLFDANTPAFMLAIRGYQFDPFTEDMTTQAKNNLKHALSFLSERLP